MDYVVKMFEGSDADLERVNHILDASTAIIEDYFFAPFDELVKSNSYTDQQAAVAFVQLAYYILRRNRPEKECSDLFDFLSHSAKRRVEGDMKRSGIDLYSKNLS